MKEPNRKTWKGQLYAHYFDEAAKVVDPHEDQLAHTQEMRARIVEDFGGYLPSSILPYRPEENFPDPLAEGRNTLGQSTDEGGDLYSGQKGDTMGRLSVFEGRLARNLVHLYSNPGDTVLDPFAGRAARLQAACHAGRQYVGFDPSQDAVDTCKAAIKQNKWSRKAKVHQTTSLDIPKKVEPGSAQLVLTCPPYGWSEFYGDNGVGLEGTPSYHDFIEELATILLLAAEALEDERYLVVVIRGWFLHKHFVDPAAHLERYFSAAGLLFHDRAVHKMSTSRERFHSDVVNWRRTAQVHEDVLVWQKVAKHRRSSMPYNRRTLEANTQRPDVEEKLRQKRRTELRRLVPTVDPVDLAPFVEKSTP